MVLLGQVSRGRDNNLNLVRLVAATAVLVSHAWPLTLGSDAIEPGIAGYSLGRIAVFVFFVISGFLITASFERSDSLFRFVAARALRLMPGLVVSLVFVAFVVGPFVTTLPLKEYLLNPKTWTYVSSGTLLVSPQYNLPGVFADNPVQALNGSIWTLFYEAACYGLVFVLGVAGMLGRVRLGIFAAAYLAFCAVALWSEMDLPYKVGRLLYLSVPFVVGMAAWAWRDRIPLSLAVAAPLAVAAALLQDTPGGYLAFTVALGYATFWIAYVPGGAIRRYNALGDYSYGVYIYAFAIQGLVVHLFGSTSIALHIALAFPATLVLAILSWRLVEAPSLALLKRLPDSFGPAAPRRGARVASAAMDLDNR